MLNTIDNIVTLNVDTQNINIDNIDDSCDFGQDKAKTKNKDYTTTLKLKKAEEQQPEDAISWKGTPKAKGNEPGSKDRVVVTAIWCNLNGEGENVLGDFTENSNKEISAFPKKVGLEDYTLYFMVYNWIDEKTEKLRGVYFIDPKIVVNP